MKSSPEISITPAPTSQANMTRRRSPEIIITPATANLARRKSPEITLLSPGINLGRRQSAWATPTLVVSEPEPEFPKALAKRRKSWHSKLERRRRKGVVVAVGGTDPHAVAAMAAAAATLQQPITVKQKRPSWWNLFVPDHWPRPRRASQDISRSGSSDPIVPWLRSKSRSVDHGFSPPFDLDSLRSKVEGRFEAVQNDFDGAESKEAGTKAAQAPRNAQPHNTVPYTVEAHDTLTSVAARFDTTPSELAKLNRLPQRMPLFPGQVLYIPADRAAKLHTSSLQPPRRPSDPGSEDAELELLNDQGDRERELLDFLRPASPLPPGGRARSPSCDVDTSSHPEQPAPERFLRINVRHITDGQGVVGGVLLVTPNAVMFDPNVSDPLVIEHGPESYGVIAPMEFVVNAAIYYDIAHMRVRHVPPDTAPRADLPKPVIYHPCSTSGHSTEEEETETTAATVTDAPGAAESSPAKDECFPELALHHTSSSGSPDNDSCSCEPTSGGAVIPREGGAFPKAFERDLVTPTHLLDAAVTSEDNKIYDSGIDMRDAALPPTAPPTEETVRKKASSVSFCSELEKEIVSDTTANLAPADKNAASAAESKKAKVFKRLSYPLTWMEGLGGDRESMNPLGSGSTSSSQPGSADSKESHHSSVFSKVFSSSPLSLVDLGTNLFVKEPPSSPHQSASSHQEPRSFFEFPPSSDLGRSSMDVARRQEVAAATVQHRASVAGLAQPKLDYRSMVSMDDMPELFVSFETLKSPLLDTLGPASYFELIPRPARPCDDPPLYLRLRMGKPINKRIPRSTAVMSYGKKKMRPEYWFSVPRNRVDDLYRFLQLWVPHLYGELEDSDVTERGFELVDSDTELWENDDEERERGVGKTSSGSTSSEIGELTRESWEVLKAPYVKFYTLLKTQTLSSECDPPPEVLSMSEELRRALYAAGGAGSLDYDVFGLPELVGSSEIVTDAHRARLQRHLPARAEGYPWTLMFSTSLHGFSLNSMFRKMAKLESPILLICQDTENNIFGALTSCALKVSDHFYGTGESFLFRFVPPAAPSPPPPATTTGSECESNGSSSPQPSSPAKTEGPGTLQVFDWSGDNIYFIKGNNESLAIGSGDGKFGLWLDGDLYQGRTQPCSTYNNVALVDGEDFVVKTLECWAFI